MSNIPFAQNESLFTSLKYKYLLNGLKWIGDFRDPDSKGLLSMKTGSLWGVGFGLQCLINARDMFLSDGTFPGDFDEKAYVAINYLIKKASFGEQMCSWDDNIWDTAVICRALIVCTNIYPEYTKQAGVLNICIYSLHWLIDKVENWRLLRYVQGMPDLSQILITFLEAAKIIPNEFLELLRINQSTDIIEDLVDEILHMAERKSELYHGHAETIVTWEDDVFSTADAIICLSSFISSPKYSNDSRILPVKDLIGYALRYLEIEQIDGKWGIEEATSVGLRAYVIGCYALGKEQKPEPHLVFKAIRYLCDSKIISSDGSIAHEMEPTIYFLLALMDVIDKWNISDDLGTSRPILEIYDYVLWNTPTRSTHERVLRLSAETERDRLKAARDQLEKRYNVKVKQLLVVRALLYILIFILLGIGISTKLGIGVYASANKMFIIPLINVPVNNWEVFLGFLTLFGGLAWFIFDRVLRWGEK